MYYFDIPIDASIYRSTLSISISKFTNMTYYVFILYQTQILLIQASIHVNICIQPRTCTYVSVSTYPSLVIVRLYRIHWESDAWFQYLRSYLYPHPRPHLYPNPRYPALVGARWARVEDQLTPAPYRATARRGFITPPTAPRSSL